MEKLQDRLKRIIEAKAKPRDNLADVDRLTDISAERWRRFVRGAMPPAEDMIEAAAQAWPEFAFWLATGLTDPAHGHVAPHTYETRFPIVRGKVDQAAQAEWVYLLGLAKGELASDAGRQPQRARLQAEVEALQADPQVAAAWLAFEQAMKILGEKPLHELFLLELDDKLSAIRSKRMASTRARLSKLAAARGRLLDAIEAAAITKG